MVSDANGLAQKKTLSVCDIIIVEERSEFMLNPVIYEVINDKWQNYAHKWFRAWFIVHILYCCLIGITVLMLFPTIYQADDATTTIPISFRCIFFIVFLKFCVTTALEALEFGTLMQQHGFKRAKHIYFEHGKDESTLSVTGLFKMILICANIASICSCISIIYYNESFLLISVLLMILLEFLYIIMFFQAYESIGILVVTISKIIARDLARFVILYSIVLLAFACSITLLKFNDNRITLSDINYNPIGELFETMFEMYETSLGLINFDNGLYLHDTNSIFAHILYVIYLLICLIMLFNLLIAMMTETTKELRDKTYEQWLLQWATVTLLIERRIPKYFYKRTGVTGESFGLSDKTKQQMYFVTFTRNTQQDQISKNDKY